MANTIADAYKPIFYAQHAFMLIEQALGLGNRVYMGYDAERKSAGLGDTISIPKPSVLVSQSLGTGTVQDLHTEKVDIVLTTGREVKFGVTDVEIAHGGERLIQDHLVPAAYRIVSDIEDALAGLYSQVPWSFDDTASSYANFLACRKILRDVAGDVIDNGDNHFAIDSTLEAAYLGLSEFKDANIIGAGSLGLTKGSIGERAGVQPFVAQKLDSHTSGTAVSAGTDVAGALTADAVKGAVSIAVGSLSGVETILAGDSFVIAGDTQRYVATATTTLAAGVGTIALSPPLVIAYSSGDVVTLEDGSGALIHAASYYSNIMLNRNAFALAFAPLPMTGDGTGAKMAIVTHPKTGMSIRSRMAYDDTNARNVVTLDVLFGVKCLDPNKAVIYRRNK